MELRVNTPTFPDVISFNFDELKQEITEKTAMYANMVYTSDQIAVAKKDVATLRKFVKAINDERKKIKKQCLTPYEDFERKIKELESIIDGSIENISGQLNAFDEQRKAEKQAQISEYFDSLVNKPDWLKLELIFDEKWLNASVSMNKVADAIDTILKTIETDLATLKKLSEFSFEAIDIYKHTLDINAAIEEGQRLVDIQKRKVEAMAEKGEMAVPATNAKPAERSWVSFSALLSTDEALELKMFFEYRDITFKAI